MLESAIAPNLTVPRSQPAAMPPNSTPPFPAYCSRFPESTKDIVMAIIGAQSHDQEELGIDTLDPVRKFVDDANCSPRFWDIASGRDSQDRHNVILIAYWSSRADYEQWTRESGFEKWWSGLDPQDQPHGWFLEVLFPPMQNLETIFTTVEPPEGVGQMQKCISAPFQEHGYWGSMRDRMPAAQTDPLVGENREMDAAFTPERSSQGLETGESNERKRVRVPGKENLCVIRSGQDWSVASQRERSLYLESMHPVLTKGMDFLRNEGKDIGCYNCRFMEIRDTNNDALSKSDRTFGLAFFNDMASLENWSKKHETHLDIFGRFLKYTKELNFDISLRLYHEVYVLKPDQQLFEYVGCHPEAGLLALM
ncbi:uncharacterized protein K452DRAFT_355386 [Aplosporella prunicola CBS 121167]|uniref:Phenylacetaldoxime dehydratase n=1 Tax=Aplosporella prunicola CBS 121167 TaxID=1176127 RepID=A0A6A6BP69_9PEZI|nr:uncharacterized protein K452DRAFT_355386 [Aplosporella prunicola CBS 121167]KAF2145866.1 hypothetical protein K452DRAFT_355386 [Aplosporella prunicola CBS 121167]